MKQKAPNIAAVQDTVKSWVDSPSCCVILTGINDLRNPNESIDTILDRYMEMLD